MSVHLEWAVRSAHISKILFNLKIEMLRVHKKRRRKGGFLTSVTLPL